ncbi:FAD-linked oxidase C-terminal domain-containing protein [Pseudohoeflea coraliihabitans]|uniref:FAD-binding oxidoreductase/transferase type 4 C-terminal domain-containing protein n=1 Tax=Pseudohoeflea coraliihabitans TaxID=2860393 RepID=A0ABS6WT80_9HYPH|nr:FAD-linked oxidase C-terminal domain-containing protein [Pseudohoeflea sp. DP4N28-3]MBW3098265.1 hypothetical protein [Pseudohoeflea sp. DP4N28-3]
MPDWVVSAAVERYAGSYSAEHGIGRRNQAYFDRYTPAALRRIAAGLTGTLTQGSFAAVRFQTEPGRDTPGQQLNK